MSVVPENPNSPGEPGKSTVESPIRFLGRSIFVVGLTLLIFCVFGQSLQFEFLNWDDQAYVVKHLERFKGLSAESVYWAFTNQENGWRTPLPYLSLFADVELYGISSSGLHFSNLLIHAASSLLLFLALRRMTGRALFAGLVSTLFAIHPLHVEPVVWVTGRWELLCGFFWIGGMWLYARYCAAPSRFRYTLVVVAYGCALMSKPMAITFPFALLLLDYWPLHRFGAEPEASCSLKFRRVGLAAAMLEKLPLLLVMGSALLVTWSAKSGYVASRSMLQFSWTEKLLNAFETYATYTMQLVWPSELSFFYLHPVVAGGFDRWQLALSALLLLTITTVVAMLGRRHRWLTTGWLWYLGVFVPAIGFLQVDHHARADRYTYLPLIGLLVMVCWAAASLCANRPAARLICCGCVLCFAVAAHRQAAHWRDSRTLFEHGVRVDSGNYKALTNLANVLARAGDLRQAEHYYERAIQVCPWDFRTLNNLGIVRYRLGNQAGARAVLERLVKVEEDLTGHYVLVHCRAEMGDTGAAAEYGRGLIQRYPANARGYAALAAVCVQTQRWSAAERLYRQALARDPARSDSALGLSDVLLQRGRSQAAVSLLESYYRRRPDRTEVANQLSWVLATHDETVRHGERAVEIAERICRSTGYGSRVFLDTLSAAYAETERFEDACRTIRAAIELAEKAGDAKHRAAMRSRLEGYRAGHPHRVQS